MWRFRHARITGWQLLRSCRLGRPDQLQSFAFDNCNIASSSGHLKCAAPVRCLTLLSSRGTNKHDGDIPRSWMEALHPSSRVASRYWWQSRSGASWSSVLEAFRAGGLVISSLVLLRLVLGLDRSDERQKVGEGRFVGSGVLHRLFSPASKFYMKQNRNPKNSSSTSLKLTLGLEAASVEFHSKLNECTAMALNGLGLQQAASGDNDGKAFELFCQASEHDYAPAQFNVGLCYERGRGVGRDLKQAAGWYAKAAALGHAKAQFNLGVLCYEGVEGIDRDVTKAVTLLEQSAKQGLEQAQLYLGLCYSNSKHMPQDLERSAKLLKAAAQRENPVAQFNLGVCYEHGHGIRKDETEAAMLYSLAAKRGHSTAQYNLGVFYERGQGGLTVDMKAASYWYEMAARSGCEKARERLTSVTEVSSTTEIKTEVLGNECLTRYDSMSMPLMMAIVH